MNKVWRNTVVVAGLVLLLGGATSWGQVPATNDKSDTHGNTGGGTSALVSVIPGSPSSYNGTNNTAYGAAALSATTSGFLNTAFGHSALKSNTTGADNTATGVEALESNIDGNNNTAVASESNTMRLGQGAVTVNGVTSGIVRTFIAGITGVAVSGSPVVINGNGQVGIQASSARYKRDIKEMGVHSQGLHQLRPVTFHYKQDAQGVRQYGLIAEEVEVVYPELVIKGADGKVESVQYHQLIPMLLNEVQHQQQEIVGLKAENARLQAELVRQNAAVAARLERLEAGAVRIARAVQGR